MTLPVHRRIRDARLKLGWSQHELGKRLGVSKASVSAWELGKSRPDVGRIAHLGELLGIRVVDLVPAA
jgi:transcriptional regulator with XRE-family HTH domain